MSPERKQVAVAGDKEIGPGSHGRRDDVIVVWIGGDHGGGSERRHHTAARV